MEYVEEVSGLTESGEIEENELSCNISTINSYDGATFNTNSSCYLIPVQTEEETKQEEKAADLL